MNKAFNTVLFLLAVQLFCSIRLDKPHDHHDIQFCWSHKYNRGNGTEATCENGKHWGLFCYEECGKGFEPHGDGCRTQCPNKREWRDDGLYCRNIEFSRPSFPIKFGEINDKGMFARCEAQYGKGNCEKYLSIVYPKCPKGYTTSGCCICKPEKKPNCPEFGLDYGVDLSCKKVHSNKHTTKPICPEKEHLDGGRCYPSCKVGYEGLGTVCYSITPEGWVGCGLGHAASKKDCKKLKKDKLFKLYYKIYKIALDAINDKCKALCDVKKAIKKLNKILKKLDKKKLEVHKELVAALKHEGLLRDLAQRIKDYLDGKITGKQDLEAILLISEKLINSFDPSIFVENPLSKYPICG